MRVLIVNSLYPPVGDGGAERSVAELAEGLAAEGIEVAVVTLAPPELTEQSNGPEMTGGGVRVLRWRLPGPWPFSSHDALSSVQKTVWHVRESYRPSARAFLRAVLGEFAPDVVHTNNIAGFGVAIFREFSGHAWVHTIRDYYLLCPRTTLYRSGARCEERCRDCSLLVGARPLPRREPDEVVGVSRRVLDVHRSAGVWTSSPTSVVPNRPFTPGVPVRTVSRIRTVGFVGRVDDAKGALVLLSAFSRPELADLRLLLAGRIGEEARGALDRPSAGGRVRHVGVLPAGALYAQVDLVVVPSQWEEPFGRVAAEAASVGLPVLVSRRGGLPEAVADVARSSVIDEAGDPDAWVRALRGATTRWRDFEVGAEGVAANTVDGQSSYTEVYERVLAGARATRS